MHDKGYYHSYKKGLRAKPRNATVTVTTTLTLPAPAKLRGSGLMLT